MTDLHRLMTGLYSLITDPYSLITDLYRSLVGLEGRGNNGIGMSGLFDRDAHGRTSLFDAAARGDMELVRKIIFTLPGTGLSPTRLALLVIQDNAGLTAADVAEQQGHGEIAQLLRGEVSRMEYSE